MKKQSTLKYLFNNLFTFFCLGILFFTALGFLPVVSNGQVVFSMKNITLPAETQKKINDSYGEYTGGIYTLDITQLNAEVKAQINKRGIAKVDIDLGKTGITTLELQVNDLRRMPDRKLESINTYKGIVNASEQNQAIIYLSGTYFGGFIDVDKKRYHIVPMKNILRDKTFSNHFLISEYEKPVLKSPDFSKTESECEEIIIEMGMHATYAFYQYVGGDANVDAEEEIIEIIEDMTGQVANFFYTPITGPALGIPFTFVIRGTMDGDPIVWKEDEPWWPETAPQLHDKLNAEWNLNRPCIPKDAIFVFAHENYPSSGQSSGGVCEDNGDVSVSYVDMVYYAHPRTMHNYAHEIGHILGAQELENTTCANDIPSECAFLEFAICDCGAVNALMCSNGIATNDIETAFLDECSIDNIMAVVNSKCNGCLGDVRSMPACAKCNPTAMIASDNELPVVECGSKSEMQFTVTACNSCDEELSIKIEAKFNDDVFNVTSEGLGDFTEVIDDGIPTNNIVIITRESELFAPNECKSFVFSAEIISLPDDIAILTPLINDQSYSAGKLTIVFPDFEQIGSTGTQSLDGLITTDPNFPPYYFLDDGCGGTWYEPFIKDKIIVEKLEIDVPYYCMDGFNFQMDPGAEIIVKTGSTLVVKNSNFFACDEMWKGITVEEGATLEIDFCTIEDAQYAIRAYGGGTLSITNNTFNRNFVGVYVDGPIPTYPDATNFTAFYGNTFDGGDALLSPYSGQSEAPASEIGDKAFAGVWVQTKANAIHSLENTFRQLSNGIYVNRTNLQITKNLFTNIWENDYADWEAGYGVRGLDYDNSYAYHFVCTGFGQNAEDANFFLCSKAIRVEGMNVGKINRNHIDAVKGIELINCYPNAAVFGNRILTQTVGIEYSHMPPGTNGIITINEVEVLEPGGIGIQCNMMGVAPLYGNGITIRDNEIALMANGTRGIEANAGNGITINENTIDIDESLSKCMGIRINSDQKSYVLCNTVQIPATLSWGSTYGIQAWDCENTKYSCNNVNNVGLGVVFEMGSFSPQNFKETTFTANKIGLKLGTTAAIGLQTHQGNKWTGSFGSYGAQHGSNSSQDWDLSRFTVHTSSSGTYRPTLPSGQSAWFATDIGGSPSSVCLVCLPPSPPDPGGDDELFTVPDASIASGSFATTAYNTEITRLAKRYLYRKLATYPGLISSGGLAYYSFYHAQSDTTIGRFYAVEKDTRNLYGTVDSLTQVQVIDNFEDLGLQMEEISEIDSLMRADNATMTLLLQRDTALQAIQGLSYNTDTLLQSNRTLRLAKADTLEQKNDDIPIPFGDVLSWNEQEVNRIFLTTVAIDTIVFNETDLGTLEDIAEQCPLTGGSAVFKARSLLSMVSDVMYDDEELCEPPGGLLNIATEEKDNSVFQVFPNPAQDEITLLLTNLSSSDGVKVVIYNTLGQAILEKIIPEHITLYKMDVSSIKEGPVLVALHKGNEQIGARKILIIR